MKNRFPASLQLYFGLLLLGCSGFFWTLFMYPPTGFYGFVVFIALGGFGVAANIFRTKRGGGELVCPSGSNCNVVVNSRFSKFLHIPLEILGMTYFALIALAYLALFLVPELVQGNVLLAVALATMAAALFSLYLLFVQAFLLGEWCMWCILSSMFSLAIFATSFVTLDSAGVPVYAFLESIEGLRSFLTFFGYALGVGASTSAVVLFFSFLNDLDISEKELASLKWLAELIWAGFGFAMVTLIVEFAVVLATESNGLALLASPVVAQIIVLLVISFTLAALMILYAPFLVFMPFTPTKGSCAAWLNALRLPTFIVGGFVLVSWYYAFTINFLPEIALSRYLAGYGAVLLIAVCAAWIIDSRFRPTPTR
ncbi:MAG: vitamin K epoxide reductase family protein, partial [Candidatus Paceibacterota bacterium]